jgi:hypothetical protein
MMGFITARVALLAEADPADRKLMRLDSPALDKEPVVYLLTIGTVPTLQRKVGLIPEVLQESARPIRQHRSLNRWSGVSYFEVSHVGHRKRPAEAGGAARWGAELPRSVPARSGAVQCPRNRLLPPPWLLGGVVAEGLLQNQVLASCCISGRLQSMQPYLGKARHGHVLCHAVKQKR